MIMKNHGSAMRRKSSKQLSIDKLLKKVYKEISYERDRVCEGCGSPYQLTHAHLIRRSWRRDLITDKRNIVYLCTECHDVFDNKPSLRHTLDNYDVWLKYIKEKDLVYYNKLTTNEDDFK